MNSDVRKDAVEHLDKTAKRNWARADGAYRLYDQYIKSKPHRLRVSIIDLLYVMNFKGGSATISEHPETLKSKLERYERALQEADAAPEFKRPLGSLDDDEYARAKDRIVRFGALGGPKNGGISGFGPSFSSALLHFHFPELVPILDKRALNGARIHGLVCDSQDQVTHLLEHYPALMDYFRDQLRADPELTVRKLDELLFIQELRRPPFRPKPPRRPSG